MAEPKPTSKQPAGAKPAPGTAPEVTDDGLLTSVQKRRINQELDVPQARADDGLDDTGAADSIAADGKSADGAHNIVGAVALDEADAGESGGDELPYDSDVNTGGKRHRLRRFFAAYGRRWWWTVPLTLLVIAALLAGIPYTRYKLAGFVISQPVTVSVTDASTKKAVTNADVILDDQEYYKTDSKGLVTIQNVKPGHHQLTVNKKYFKSSSSDVFVDLTKASSQDVVIQATGRQVPVTVKDKITAKPLENVTLAAGGSDVKTDKDGKAVIVLPADKQTLSATLSNGGYNTLETKVTVTEQSVKENDFTLVPSGKLYFLSRQSGKIDVVKTDLDGGKRETVVGGTGKEDDRNTVLLASRDWKYLAFYSKRDSGLPKLYLIDTSNDKMTEMDSGDASISLSGWSGHNFVYEVTRNKPKLWDANRQAVKSFDADKRQIFTMDQNNGEQKGSVIYFQTFNNYQLIGDKLIFTVSAQKYDPVFNSTSNDQDKGDTLRVVTAGQTGKNDIKTFPYSVYWGISLRLYEPSGLYIAAYNHQDGKNKNEYFEYENGQVKAADIEDNAFYNDVYPTYLFSPDGQQTFWSEQRDGKPNFFVGDQDAKNEKLLTTFEDGQVYGWYGPDYLLLSKKGSELYIMPVKGGTPFKVSDYHKPQISYFGYGGGYGGL